MNILDKMVKYSVLLNPSSKKKTSSTEIKFREAQKKYYEMTNATPWMKMLKFYLPVDQETKLEECVIIQKDETIQQVFGFRGHDIESFSADYISQVFEFFNSQIKSLGDGWMISVEAQRFRMHEYPGAVFNNVAALLVDLAREQEFRESGEHFDSSYYLNICYKPESQFKRKAANFFFTDAEKKDLLEPEIENFRKTVENITGVLSNRLIIRPLTCEETVCYIHSTVSTRRHEIMIPPSFFHFDSFITDDKMEIGSTLRLGDYYIPILQIKDFPTDTYPAILNELNKLNIEYRWVSRYFPLSREQALKELKQYQQNAAAEKKSAGQMMSEMDGKQTTLENHAAVASQKDVEAAMYELGTDTISYGYYNSGLMVWDEDLDEALVKLKKCQTVVERCRFNCDEERFGALDAFKGMIAGECYHAIRRPMVSSGNFTHTLPFSAIWAGIEHNKFMGEVCGVDCPLITCATNYGTNFYLNLNEGDVGHTLILGPTGAGKSTLLNLIAISALKYPDIQLFFLDYGLSSLTLTLSVGGTYINPADETVCFQPLRDIHIRSEFVWAVEFVKTLIEIQGVRIEPKMGVAIESAMIALVEMPLEMRTLTTLRLNLEYTDERGHRILDDALSPYCIGGRFGKIFDGDRTSLGKSRWVLFEMEHLMNLGSDCSGPAILFIFHFLEKSFTGCLTFFIMDECWFGLENPAIQAKMKEYLLTLRKKNVFCIFATQNPSAIANSPMASTMIQNCPTQIFLADPRAEKLKDDYAKLGLSEEEVHLLSMCTKKRDYYYKSGLGTRLFQLMLSPLELAMFRGKESKFKTINGEIRQWSEFQNFLLSDWKKKGINRPFVDQVLKVQGIEFEHYLKNINWKEYMVPL